MTVGNNRASQPRGGFDGMELRSSPRVIAPDWADRLRAIPGPAWLLVLVFVAIFVLHDPRHTQWLVVVTVIGVLFGGPVVLKYLNTRIRVTDEYVETRDSLRRTSRCPRNALKRLVTVRIQVLGPRFGLRRVLMLDDADRARLSLQVDAWSDEQLMTIYRWLGLPVSDQEEVLRPRSANRKYRGSASVVLRYWPFFALVVFAAVFFIFGTIVSALHR